MKYFLLPALAMLALTGCQVVGPTDTTPSTSNDAALEKIMAQLEAMNDKIAELEKAKPAEPTAPVAPTIDAEKAKEILALKDTDYIQGAADAPLTLIEYSDFECPFCKRFHETVGQVMAAYDGKVNFIFRHFPLSFHEPNATEMAIAVECAGDQKGSEGFYALADEYYTQAGMNKIGLPDGKTVADLAEEVGLDRAAFEACTADGAATRELIKTSIAEASQIGVQGTPGSFLFNPKTGDFVSIRGAQPYANVQAQIEAMLGDL
ncbi:thioredoxin domain-containing protein [Candidatus Peribacteria bacterium]|nr:thioredoxin domain-containing protein [Candidatus Peribacteria bacterium]